MRNSAYFILYSLNGTILHICSICKAFNESSQQYYILQSWKSLWIIVPLLRYGIVDQVNRIVAKYIDIHRINFSIILFNMFFLFFVQIVCNINETKNIRFSVWNKELSFLALPYFYTFFFFSEYDYLALKTERERWLQ